MIEIILSISLMIFVITLGMSIALLLAYIRVKEKTIVLERINSEKEKELYKKEAEEKNLEAIKIQKEIMKMTKKEEDEESLDFLSAISKTRKEIEEE